MLEHPHARRGTQIVLLRCGTMIRRGRTEGWLKRPVEEFPAWASFHGVTTQGIRIGPLPGFEHRGSTVIADRDLAGGKEGPLITVPKELILSRQNVDLVAKSDQHLREVLHALGEFGWVRFRLENAALALIQDDRRPAVPCSYSYSCKRPCAVQMSRTLVSIIPSLSIRDRLSYHCLF